ncbi:T-complex protein 1 subunit theta [Lathyrus oleraceus]|uniref:T-complex protein 1 subunit theta n=1 Tax=Pisum sativum TaxID=3888 RepID=UPI0021CF5B09|nr:T-complex protein 1 subunit theta-like [Pisum sativum]
MLLPDSVGWYCKDSLCRHIQILPFIVWPQHKLPVLCMNISSDGDLIVTGSADKNIKIWGLDFGDCHKSIFAHADSVMAVQFVPKMHYVFSVGKDRVVKLLGGGMRNSTVVQGMVLRNDVVGSIKRIEKAKVVVFAGGVDTSATETKGTAKVEELIKAVVKSDAKVVVSGGAVGEMALHFCERYKLIGSENQF